MIRISRRQRDVRSATSRMESWNMANSYLAAI
ncbi:MAG: hypothetical protein K0Q72_4517 [Armatimonadetes bacterium]|nr:hypothetical protein [Armatimonadota bacterium]